MTLQWVIETDRDRCIGSGACAFGAPHVFDVDDTGKVVLVGEPQVGDQAVADAVEHCPTDALRLVEEDR